MPRRVQVELADGALEQEEGEWCTGTGGRFRLVVRLNWLMEQEEGSAPWLG